MANNSSDEEYFYDSEEEYEKERANQYFQALKKFVSQMKMYKSVIKFIKEEKLSMAQREHLFEQMGIDSVLMDLCKRPPGAAFVMKDGFSISLDRCPMCQSPFEKVSKVFF